MSTLRSNYTEEFISRYLKELKIETIYIVIPAIVFLAGIAVFGAVGNSLVLIVYWRKRTSSPNRIFILTLSSFDLLTNVFVVPEDIYDMFDFWTFNRPALCKARHYMYTCNTIASSLALLAICVTRYRKICQPFGRQVTITHAKLACIVLTVLSLLFSVPTAMMCGVSTVKTPQVGINGYICGYENAYWKTIWPLVNWAFFILLFILVCFPLVILYILIGLKARHHRSFRTKSMASSSYSTTSSSQVRDNASRSTEEKTNVRKSNRTTVMQASITIVFIVSFLPFLAVMLYWFCASESFIRNSPVEFESLCHVLLRFYLLNTAANPVIYNLCDVNFRRECCKLLKFW